MRETSLHEPATARAASLATAKAAAIEQRRRNAVKGWRRRPFHQLWRHGGNAVAGCSVPGRAAGSVGHGMGLPDAAKDTPIFVAGNPS
jgi:hypothetical protein